MLVLRVLRGLLLAAIAMIALAVGLLFVSSRLSRDSEYGHARPSGDLQLHGGLS